MKIWKNIKKRQETAPDDIGPCLMTADEEAAFFSNLFINSPIGIYIVQDQQFRFVNPEFQMIAGYPEAELIGMAPGKIVHPEDREIVRANAIAMLKGERTNPYVYRAVRKNGDIKWIIETVASIRYGGERACLGYFMDTTESELAKEALRRSEEKFHKAFRSSPDWLVISTLEDGFYVDVNDAFLEATGYRRDEVIGRGTVELGIWANPEDRARMVQTLREEGVVRNMEFEFRMKSGEIRTVLWSAEVIKYGDEECLIALTRDITDRKKAENERIMREKVQGVLETAGAASHELNQPLQYIYYLLDEILEENPDSRPARDLKKQCDRMREITTKLESITTYEITDYVQGSRIVDIYKSSEKT